MRRPQPSDLETRDPAARDPQEAIRRASGDAPALGRGAPAGASEREALGRGPGRGHAEAQGAARARGASSRRGLVLFGALGAALVVVLLVVLL